MWERWCIALGKMINGKRIILIMFLFCLVVVPPAFAAESLMAPKPLLPEVGPGNAYIPAGTVINCELITPLSSAQNAVGQAVMFRTIESLNVANVPIIRYGTAGKAYVSIARKAGNFGVGGKIEMRPVSLKTIDGIEIPVVFGVNINQYENLTDIDTTMGAKGLQKAGGGKHFLAGLFSAGGVASVWYGLGASNKSVIDRYNKYWPDYVAGGLLLIFSAAALQGEDQQIPPFTRFQVTVVKDVDLKVAKEELPEKMKPYLTTTSVETGSYYRK